METLHLINDLWQIMVAFVTLVVILAQAYMRINVLEEKVKTLFDLLNNQNKK